MVNSPGHVPQFDQDWDHHTNKMGFYNQFGKMLGHDGSLKKVYYDGDSAPSYQARRGHTNDDPVVINEKERGFGRIKASKHS
jgi:hypothetical protein